MGPKDPGDHATIDQSWDVSDARAPVDLDTDMQDKVDAPAVDPLEAALSTFETQTSDKNPAQSANDRSGAAPVNDRTIAGLGVHTPAPSPVLKTSALDYPPDLSPRAFNSRNPRPRDTKPPVLREPGKGPITLERANELHQPERSPFDLVMEGLNVNEQSRPKARESHDLSQFVSNFAGDTPPPVEIENPLGSAMEPVQRKARKRKQWLAIGAIAATAIVGTAVGMKVAGGSAAPKPAASHVAAAEPSAPTPAPAPPAEVAPPKAEVAQPAAAAEPPPSEPPSETPPSEPTVPPQPAAKVELVATTSNKDNVVAMKTPTAKKPTTTTKTTTAKKTTTATKTTSSKKAATTKKSTTAKKSTTTKKTAAKKPTTKKTTKPAPKKTTKKKSS